MATQFNRPPLRRITDFKSKLVGGGARPNLFEVELAFPEEIAIDNDVKDKARFLVKAAALPASNITPIDVNFRGRILTNNPADYQEDAYVHQLDRDGSTLRCYRFYDIFPTNISQVDLSYETVDTIEEFTVELQVLYFESIKGVGDNAGGESIS